MADVKSEMENLSCLMAITGMDRLGGGIARVNRLVYQSLQDAGYKIDVLALSEPSLSGREAILVNDYQGFDEHKIKFSLTVWTHLFRRRYKVLFCDHINLAAILAPLGLVGLVRYIVWLHGVEVFSPRPDLEGRLGLKYAGKRLASSNHTRQRVIDRYPMYDVRACDLALDPQFYDQELPVILDNNPKLELIAVDGNRRIMGIHVILCVARMSSFERYKGQDTLIEAFPQIRDAYPDAQLVLVGEGDDFPRLHDLAQKLGSIYSQGIFMPGRVDQMMLHRLYRSCALFAMPSTGEGFGIVFLEAMSYGKPCIGGAQDAAPGVIRDKSTGIILEDPQSSAQVACAIIDLFSDVQRMKRMGQSGYELVQSRYLYQHFKDRFWAAIQSEAE